MAPQVGSSTKAPQLVPEVSAILLHPKVEASSFDEVPMLAPAPAEVSAPIEVEDDPMAISTKAPQANA
ncbi:hypothetical protein COCNU_13G008430 [Cocos nucifera]|uniref:Uncharacterized protein n=1 Tax=Cocos nucifera TaxID=13894 RepID=A0A8K0NBT4_COCNU|nr:hypothetical protein COCNU_13G008430 [Cocos nucifera]